MEQIKLQPIPYPPPPSPLKTLTLLKLIHGPSLRYDFLNKIFDTGRDDIAKQASTNNNYEAFFAHYCNRCRLAANKSPEIEHITQWRILEIIALLKDIKQSRETILQSTTLEAGITLPLAETLLDLAASTYLLLSVGSFPDSITHTDAISWKSGKLTPSTNNLNIKLLSTAGLINTTFPPPPQHPSSPINDSRVKLPQSFTAGNISKIGGITIRFTDNLADHLLLREDDTLILLYHHASLLHLHATSPTSLLPTPLITETLLTLSLLLPPVLGAPNPWYKSLSNNNSSSSSSGPQNTLLPLDPLAGQCPRLNSTERRIENFAFWRERLVLLKRTYDEAEPRTLGQLWWDDRRKTQWFTFWVAVGVLGLTVVFGVVQSVAGCVQAWASVRALR